jgi:hypothetical protein
VYGINTLIIKDFHKIGFRAGKQSQAVKAGGPLLTLGPDRALSDLMESGLVE